MRLSWLALSCASALFAGPSASADVIVVDQANGPGTDFTRLSTAITAAASGDVLLVRAGTYTGNFVVTGKSLSIVAENDAQVSLLSTAPGFVAQPALQLGSFDDLPVVVRGLTLGTVQQGAAAMRVSGTATPGGHAFIEECTITSSADAALAMDNVSPATVTRCTLQGAAGSLVTGNPGQPALVIEDGPFGLFGGTAVGGEGRDAGLLLGLLPVPGEHGSPGVRMTGSDPTPRVLTGALAIGGHGGDGALEGGCLPPGDGGDGVLNAADGDVLVGGIFGLGDLGGTAAPGCGANGVQGGLLASLPPAPLPQWMLAAVPGSVTLPRVRREKQLVPITVQAPLDQSVALLVGTSPMFEVITSLNGAQVVDAISVVPLAPLPFTGTLEFQWRVPELGPGVQSRFLYLQPISMQASGVKTLGQPSVMLMLDSSL